MQGQREQVAVLLLSKPDFNIYAFKYILLTLNKHQKHYEFVFPDIEYGKPVFSGAQYTTAELLKGFEEVKNQIRCDSEPSYWINIICSRMEDNDFACWEGTTSFITTYSWDKIYSPPSVFEYLIHSTLISLLCLHPQLGKLLVDTHWDTRGCCFDYTRDKKDNKVDVSLGYVCDECRTAITSMDPELMAEIDHILSRAWIGKIDTFDSVAYNLKCFFRFDINRDSGFNKTWLDKVKDYVSDIPKAVVVALVSVLLGVLGTLLTSYLLRQ